MNNIKLLLFLFSLGSIGTNSVVGQKCIEGFIIQNNKQKNLSVGLLGFSESENGFKS